MVELIRRSESVMPNGAFFWREVVLCVGGSEGEEREGEREGEREKKEGREEGKEGEGEREGGRSVREGGR